MNPYLLFILLDLPFMPGPVLPEEYPSSYTSPESDGFSDPKYFLWPTRDTLTVRTGENRELGAMIVLSAGCPMHETHFSPGRPDRTWDFTCSGGKVAGWRNGLSDSGNYFYTGGRLDSLIRFERILANRPATVSRITRITSNGEGWPIHSQDYWYEGTDTLDDSLTTNFVYHLPDSLEIRSFSGPDAETRVTMVRLSAGKIVSMTETQTQDGHVYVYQHMWGYGETIGIRDRGSERRVDRHSRLPGRLSDFGWRLDGRVMPQP